MPFDRDFRPRVDAITEAKIKKLAQAWGMKPNVLLREFAVAATKMVEHIQRHPEVLGDYDWKDFQPETLLWRAGQAKALQKNNQSPEKNNAA